MNSNLFRMFKTFETPAGFTYLVKQIIDQLRYFVATVLVKHEYY